MTARSMAPIFTRQPVHSESMWPPFEAIPVTLAMHIHGNHDERQDD